MRRGERWEVEGLCALQEPEASRYVSEQCIIQASRGSWLFFAKRTCSISSLVMAPRISCLLAKTSKLAPISRCRQF